MQRKKVLVTGAEGFVGRHLVKALPRAGFEPVPYTAADGDITDCDIRAENIFHVIHLAALTFVPRSWEEPKAFYRVNVQGTANVLEYCRHNACGLTLMSTYVYGVPEYLPVDERHPLRPNSPYNHSKFLAEQLCAFYHQAFSCNITIFRPFNIYGSGQSGYFLIPEIIGQLLDSAKPEVRLQNLAPKRDYVHVDDVVRALLLSVGANSGLRTYNLGSGTSWSVEELANLAMKAAGVHKPLVGAGQERRNEVMDIRADISLAMRELNWQPVVSIDEGLGEMIRGWSLQA